ncbi:MAG: GDSL-type esterase/lipase family protein [Rikenellaceae bacterium]
MVIRFIPAFTLFGVEIKRADILSQIVDQIDETKGWEAAELESRDAKVVERDGQKALKIDEKEFGIDMRKVAREAAAARASLEKPKRAAVAPKKTSTEPVQSWSDLLRQQRDAIAQDAIAANVAAQAEAEARAAIAAAEAEAEAELRRVEQEYEAAMMEPRYNAPKLEITGGTLAKSGRGRDLVARRNTRVGLIPAGERVLSSRIALTEIADFEKQNHIEKRGLDVNMVAPSELPFSSMDRFYAKLATPRQTTRIAFLGDSFIEADILTADFRESMHDRYGGCGAGFVPFASVVSKYRKTVKTVNNDWTIHNVLQREKAPKRLADWWFVSGATCTPNCDGAAVKWTTVTNRTGVDKAYTARLFFASEGECLIETRINNEEWKPRQIRGSKWLQQAIFRAEGFDEMAEEREIYSFEVRVVSGFESFIGYGALFESDQQRMGGVVVDNYSIRSNDGQAVLWTNPAINSRFDSFVGGYDLVVLQYGLNIMERGVSDYSEYGEQLKKLVSYAKSCFPNAAIMVLGVSDRSTRKNGRFEPLEEARMLADCQREVARDMGLAYWDIYDAMQQRGGMSQFVSRDWAGKDYTHLNFDGGREVGRALAEAVHVARYRSYPIVTELGKEVEDDANSTK